MTMKSWQKWTTIAVIAWLATGCDPERKKKCEWFLVPETELAGSVASPNIPVCARNFVSMKQDCKFQADEELAKKAWNKKFRFVDMDFERAGGFPRQIKNVKFCE